VALLPYKSMEVDIFLYAHRIICQAPDHKDDDGSNHSLHHRSVATRHLRVRLAIIDIVSVVPNMVQTRGGEQIEA
jgi:hypothetical protein